MQLNPYLNFNGQCKEAFQFYADVLGGKLVAMFTFGETPMAEHVQPEARNLIVHARLVAGDDVLMGSDCPPGMEFEAARGLCVSLNVDTPAEAERIYQALSQGGSVQMPMEETFWAHRFAMLRDRFGTPWMINCEKAG